MGKDMGKETGNVSQRERKDHRTGILVKKKNKEWRQVMSGGEGLKKEVRDPLFKTFKIFNHNNILSVSYLRN